MASLLHSAPKHGLDRPYKCSHCSKDFRRQEHQTRHIRIHTGEKPYACIFPACTKRFSRSDERDRHRRTHKKLNPQQDEGQKHADLSAVRAGFMKSRFGLAHTMPPSIKSISRSAQGFQLGSQNFSSPRSVIGYSANMGNDMAAYYQGDLNRSNSNSPSGLPRHWDLLPDAASRLEQPPSPYSHSSRYHMTNDYFPCHSRLLGRSPTSTAPSSPIFSHDYCILTPDHSPLAIPGKLPYCVRTA